MNPLVRMSDNMDKLHAATEWAVEVGDYDVPHYLWSEWNANFRHSFQWIQSCQGSIQHYGDMDLKGGQSLYVKCDFFKVNNCVLMLFQPHGRFSAHREMENQVQSWMGNSDRFSITNAMNFYDNKIWSDIIDVDIQQEEQLEQKSFPYGAKSAVLVEDEYHLIKFVQKAKSRFAERDVSFIRLPQSEVKEFKLGDVEEGKLPMYVHKQADLINGFVVTFFSNSGNYGDRQALLEKTKEWFPDTRQLVSREKLFDLLPMIGNPEFSPIPYRSLV